MEEKKKDRKNEEKNEKEKISPGERRRPCRKELTLTGCNVHMCIYVQLTVIFGENKLRGVP